jgi:hypothetical protein
MAARRRLRSSSRPSEPRGLVSRCWRAAASAAEARSTPDRRASASGNGLPPSTIAVRWGCPYARRGPRAGPRGDGRRGPCS